MDWLGRSPHAGSATRDTPAVATSRLMGRAFGVLFVGAPVFGAVWWVLPDSDVRPSPLLPAVLVVAAAIGLVLLVLSRRIPERYYSPVLLVGTAAISVALYLTGDPTTGTVMLYLWATPYAFWFFSLPRALVHAATAAASCAVTLVVLAPDPRLLTLAGTHYLGTWLHMVVTMGVVGMLVRWLVRWLHRYSGQLAARTAAQAALVQLGHQALAGQGLDDLFSSALTMAGEGDETIGAALYRVQPGDGALHLLLSRGRAGEALAASRQVAAPGSQCGYTVAADGPVVCDDLASEDRFHTDDLLLGLDVRSTVTIPVRLDGAVFGVLGAYSTSAHRFTSDDVSFLLATANVLSAAIQRDAAERRMRYAALHDPLTGLPNRALLLDRIEQALATTARTGEVIAVMLLDLDGFKVVNDSLGHAAGDQLLATIAPRLAAAVRRSDTVARLGGDEFVLLCKGLTSEAEAREVAERVCASWSEPIQLDEASVFVSGSIGIAIAAAGDATAEDLVRDADAAMYRAKTRGRGSYEIYGDDLRSDARLRLEREGQLRGAVERQELKVVYQPVVDLATGAVVGAEALLRWHHPELGVVPPADFISLAEETGTIVEIGRWVLGEACAQLARWHDTLAGEHLHLTVNVSPRQLADPQFADEVVRVVQEHGLAPGFLGLELTESVLMDSSVDTLRALHRLRAAGVLLLLDDFGTGYSSLGYLKRFPIDVLKLDRSFVTDLGHRSRDTALVRAVVEMATALGLPVVAEGVESDAQAKALHRLGCRSAQGFLWSAGVPADDFVDTVRRLRPQSCPAVS